MLFLVIIVRNNKIDRVECCYNSLMGKNMFLELCAYNFKDWSQYTQEQKDEWAEKGYVDIEGGSINLIKLVFNASVVPI